MQSLACKPRPGYSIDICIMAGYALAGFLIKQMAHRMCLILGIFKYAFEMCENQCKGLRKCTESKY